MMHNLVIVFTIGVEKPKVTFCMRSKSKLHTLTVVPISYELCPRKLPKVGTCLSVWVLEVNKESPQLRIRSKQLANVRKTELHQKT